MDKKYSKFNYSLWKYGFFFNPQFEYWIVQSLAQFNLLPERYTCINCILISLCCYELNLIVKLKCIHKFNLYQYKLILSHKMKHVFKSEMYYLTQRYLSFLCNSRIGYVKLSFFHKLFMLEWKALVNRVLISSLSLKILIKNYVFLL
jgi:hypothetical protein